MDRKSLDSIGVNRQRDMMRLDKLLHDGEEHDVVCELGWEKRKVQRVIECLNEVYGDDNNIHYVRSLPEEEKKTNNIIYKMDKPQMLAFPELLFDSNDRDYIFSLYRLIVAIGETIPTENIIKEDTDGRFETGCDIFKGKIDVGSSTDKTKKNLVKLYKYLINNKVVRFRYPLKDNKDNVATVSPYCIKTYNSKWYLFGYQHIIGGNPHKWDIYDLNLITDINECRDKTFRAIDIKEINRYYEHQIGFYPKIFNRNDNNRPTQKDIDDNIWEVKFRIADPETNDEEKRKQIKRKWFWYIKTNPLHKSQVLASEDDSKCEYVFRIEVVNSPNLLNLLRFRGAEIEILEPKVLRNRMKNESQRLYNLYNKEDNK